MPISTTDPRSGEVIRTFDELTDEQLEDRIARAAAAAATYRLKFMRGGRVVWIDVDARNGKVLQTSGD